MIKQLNEVSESDRMLEAISAGSMPPAEAFAGIRSYVRDRANDPGALEDTYEAVLDLVWNLVAGRERGPSLDLWGDFVLKVRQLFRSRDTSLAERFTSLADMLEQSARFADVHSAEAVRERKHDPAVLQLLYGRSRPVERSYLIEKLEIGESNLSRVLLNLVSAGLIAKSTKGREVFLELTPEGRAAAAKIPSKAEEHTASMFDNPDVADALGALWKKTGCALAVTDEKSGLVDCDDTFASLLKGNAKQLRGQQVASLRKTFGDQISGLDEVAPDEIALADGRVYRVAEHDDGGRSVWLGFDVTAYKRRIEEARRREKLLLREIDALKSKHAPAHRLRMHDMPGMIVHDAVRFAPVWSALLTLRHDILMPVNAILSFAQLMQDKETCLGRAGFYEDTVLGILTQAHHVRTLVKDLFNTGELLENLPAHAIGTFNPAVVVDDVLKSVRYSSRHSNLSFAPSVAQSAVKTDERVFRGVFLQAVSGFLELLPSGGKVSIEGSIEDHALKVRISTPTTAMWDVSAFRNEPTGLIMCGWAVEHAGGKFDYNRSTHDGAFAEFRLPVLNRPHARTRSR
jgi:DNA-binding MarR family transcriptional regulator/signal transduction histidine kinase